MGGGGGAGRAAAGGDFAGGGAGFAPFAVGRGAVGDADAAGFGGVALLAAGGGGAPGTVAKGGFAAAPAGFATGAPDLPGAIADGFAAAALAGAADAPSGVPQRAQNLKVAALSVMQFGHCRGGAPVPSLGPLFCACRDDGFAARVGRLSFSPMGAPQERQDPTSVSFWAPQREQSMRKVVCRATKRGQGGDVSRSFSGWSKPAFYATIPRGEAMPAKDPAAATCPRCARVLPPGAAKVCVYCGNSLAAPARPNVSLGFGFSGRPARDPLIGQTLAGRFKIEELIGQGGMGRVYRARHLALDRQVCLKVLKTALLDDPTLVGRFEREAKAASRLNHPNGIQVLDFGRADTGALYIVMEYVQGKDLRAVLRDEWPLPEERLCNIMAQVLAALAEAHAHSVVHRDLKPENIMVEQRRDQPDFVKVLDFGIAKILDSDMPGLTRNDVVCGTPQYMAPEQATGTALDARCDLYAVGVIMYQMTTGHLPFDGQNSMEVLTKHVHEQPVPPRRRKPDAPISAEMEAVILRALQKDPLLRPQTAEEFRQLLLELPLRKRAAKMESSAPTPPRGTLPAHRAARALKKRRIWPLVAGASLAVGAAGLAIGMSRRSPPAPVEKAPAPMLETAAIAPAPSDAAPAARDPRKAKELVERAATSEADDPGSARDLLEEAVRLDPDNAEAHYRLGGLFLNSQPERAKIEYAAAKRLNAAKYRDIVDTILKGI